jgi:ABC-type sugar transport system ATPase subunit
MEVREITKEFPGVKALDNVSIKFNSGEVHALVGMNGSGKSTLLKIITGVYAPDSGNIFVGGEEACFRGVVDSRAAG